MFYPFVYQLTETLALVKPSVAMAPDLLTVIDQNRAHIGRFLDWVDHHHEVSEQETFLKLKLTEEAAGKAALFFILERDALIGSIDLHQIERRHQTAEIGYWLAADATGRGIMGQAVDFLTRYAFQELGLEHLTILADVANHPSNSVAQKAGFTFVGTDPGAFLLRGERRDVNRWSLQKTTSTNQEGHK